MICGITTAPRDNGAYYLDKTVESLALAEPSDVVIFAEPGSRIECPGRSPLVIQNIERLGNWGNFRECAAAVLDMAIIRGHKHVVTCEDDVVFHKDALKIADSELTRLELAGEPVGFLALYTSSIYQRAIPEGTHYYKATSLWGACALAWPVESLKLVLDHPVSKKWRGLMSNPPPLGHPDICHADTCIGNVIIKLGLKTFFMNPAVCQHIGEVSSLRRVKLTAERQAAKVLE